MNLNTLKNAGAESVWIFAAFSSLDFLNKGLQVEAVISGVLALALCYLKYHYFATKTPNA